MLNTIFTHYIKLVRSADAIRIRSLLVTSIFVLLLMNACEDYSQGSYEEHVVLEAYAKANRPLPEVRLSKTLPTEQEYSFEEAALEGANVQVVLLKEGGAEEEVFDYHSSETKGVYIAKNPTHRMLPRRTYQINIDFDNRSEVLHAETTIPDDIEIINDVPDTVVYQSPEQMELVISAFEQTQKQSIFVFNTVASDPEPENLTPFYKDLVEEDDDTEVEDFYNTETTPINEGNFDMNEDGTITVQFPWIGVAFFGENRVITNSIDENLSDLISSQEVQLGGGTLSPGEIPNLRYHVEGGIGIFGSFASDTVHTFFKRQEGM